MEPDYYEKLDQLMESCLKVSIAFSDLNYFVDVVNVIPSHLLLQVEELFDHMYIDSKRNQSFMVKYRYLKNYKENKIIFQSVKLDVFYKPFLICKN